MTSVGLALLGALLGYSIAAITFLLRDGAKLLSLIPLSKAWRARLIRILAGREFNIAVGKYITDQLDPEPLESQMAISRSCVVSAFGVFEEGTLIAQTKFHPITMAHGDSLKINTTFYVR